MAEIVVCSAEQLRDLVREAAKEAVREELQRAKGGDLVSAAASGLSVRTFRLLVRKGILDGRKVGRAYLVRRESLERYLAERNAPAAAPEPTAAPGAIDADEAIRNALDVGRLRVVGE